MMVMYGWWSWSRLQKVSKRKIEVLYTFLKLEKCMDEESDSPFWCVPFCEECSLVQVWACLDIMLFWKSAYLIEYLYSKKQYHWRDEQFPNITKLAHTQCDLFLIIIEHFHYVVGDFEALHHYTNVNCSAETGRRWIILLLFGEVLL